MSCVNKFMGFTSGRRRRRGTRAPPMALHELPMLRDPPVAGGSGLAPRAEPEEEYLELDDFEDAVEDPTSGELSLSLSEALSDCQQAITRFFNNDPTKAAAIMTPWKHVSLYHSHGATIFEFIPALLTLEPTQIQRAQEALRKTFDLCAKQRRNYTFVQSIGAIIKKPNYAGYTEEEAHAELIHSEALLLQACLTTLDGDEVTGLLRASLRVKSSFDCYRTCAKILKKKRWDNEDSRTHFESGVRLGLATFNIMVAMLPPKIITLLEFVGFTANKEQGRDDLMVGATSPGLRSVLCQLTLLIYYLVIGQFAAIPPDFTAAEILITSGLQQFPNSVWFLMFKARMQMLRGMIEEAVITYQAAANISDMWPQLKHVNYWELIWAHALMLKWKAASEYANYLVNNSKWSKTIYIYTEAACLMELGHLSSLEERKRSAHLVMQKILGRSLPMEKFVVQRCERWAKRGYLVLPGVELVCLWNVFPSLALDPHYADLMLKVIEQTHEEVINVMNSKYKIDSERRYIPPYDSDDLALVCYLRGCLLAAMSLPRLGIRHLEAVLKMKDDIKENTHLLPYTTVEIAMCYYILGDRDRAVELLHDARKKYTGYLLESRLHFRIHAKLEIVQAGVPPTVVAGTTAEAVAVSSVSTLATAGSAASGAAGGAASGAAGSAASGAAGSAASGAPVTDDRSS